MIRRAYLAFDDGRQTHFRRAGAGDPIILLHPSPLSSEWMEPMMEVLSDIAEVIAPDTPGYAASDPLPEPEADAENRGQRPEQHPEQRPEQHPEQPPDPTKGLEPYVHWLLQFMRALGIERAGLYGSATGAQIAIEFARAHPDSTRFVVLDNVAHFTAAEREQMLERYFPDLAPRADGSHLLTAWSMVRGLWQWFPWYRQDEEHRIAEPSAVPEKTLRRMLVDHLAAGPDYARAYRAALHNEDAANVREIAVPVRIIRWRGSPLRRYADRFDEFDWPPHIRMAPCGPAMEERLKAIRRAVVELDGPAASGGPRDSDG